MSAAAYMRYWNTMNASPRSSKNGRQAFQLGATRQTLAARQGEGRGHLSHRNNRGPESGRENDYRLTCQLPPCSPCAFKQE
jgi:hypothetical protein